jgi:exportin-2 (importin alpha re-exporter)
VRVPVSLASLQSAVMSDIPKLLLESLNPHTRKQAEQALDAYSRQPAFVVHLLQLVLATSNNAAVRLAASVYLKNRVKLGWLDDVRQSPFYFICCL